MSKLLYTSCTSSFSSIASTMRSTFFASSADVIGTTLSDTIGASADSTTNPASSSVDRRSNALDASVVTLQLPPSSVTSSAPASRAASSSASSSAPPSTMTIPRRANCQLTAPGSASDPPRRVNTPLISEPVRLRLSVSTSMSRATPPGA